LIFVEFSLRQLFAACTDMSSSGRRLLVQVALYNTCGDGITCTTHDITTSYTWWAANGARTVSSYLSCCLKLDDSSVAGPASGCLWFWYSFTGTGVL